MQSSVLLPEHQILGLCKAEDQSRPRNSFWSKFADEKHSCLGWTLIQVYSTRIKQVSSLEKVKLGIKGKNIRVMSVKGQFSGEGRFFSVMANCNDKFFISSVSHGRRFPFIHFYTISVF